MEKEPKKRNFKTKYLYFAFLIFLVIALSITFFFLIYYSGNVQKGINKLISALKPFIYGAVIAYVLIPLCRFYENRIKNIYAYFKTRKMKSSTEAEIAEKNDAKKLFRTKAHEKAEGFAIVLSLATLVLIIYILISLILPELIVSMTIITESFDTYYATVTEWIENFFKNNDFLRNYVETISANLSGAIQSFVENELLPNTKTIISSFSSGVMTAVSLVTNIFVGLIVAIYLLKLKDNFCAQCRIFLHSIMKPKYAKKIIEEVNFANEMFMGFISGRLLDSAIVGILCFIGMTIIGLPYPLLISVLIGLTNIIPFFGPFIGGVPAVLLIFMISPMQALWFLIFLLILQQLDGNLIGPAILGNMTNLNSFWVLFALMLFSGLFGFTGMLVGVPVFAVIYHIVQELIMKGLKKFGYEPTGREAEISGYNDYQQSLIDKANGTDKSNKKTFGDIFSKIFKKKNTAEKK